MRRHHIAQLVANIGYLKRYLEEKPLDVANNWDWLIRQNEFKAAAKRAGVNLKRFREEAEEATDEYYAMAHKIEAAMTVQEKEQAAEYVVRHNSAEAPTWAHMEYREPVPPGTWLVHFSDQAHEVAEQGMKRGVEVVTRLGLTTHLHDNEKKYGGYNFAFEALSRDAQSAAYDRKYGDSAVLFQAMGLKAYHYGDEEHQVIVWGLDLQSNRFVTISRDGNEWCVVSKSGRGRECFYKGPYKAAVSWVMKHNQQYRRHIT